MLTRRSFLTALLGASAAAVALPRVEWLSDTILPFHSPAWTCSFEAVHRAAATMFRQQMGLRGLQPEIINGSALGHGPLRHQWNVSLPPWHVIERSGEAAREHYFEPAIELLANSCAKDGLDLYGQLKIHERVDYCANIDCLRMTCGYDATFEVLSVRWDIIGGASAIGAQIARRNHANDLKQWIRLRLHDYQPIPLPA